VKMMTPTVVARRNGPAFDFVLAVAAVFVSIVGVVMVYTATRGSLLAQGEDPKAYLKKQALYAVLGVIAMVAVALLDYRRLEPIAMILYCLSVLSLLAVFAIGSDVQGAARWFVIGPIELQPSEFGVVALVLAVAAYCDRRTEEGLAWKDVFKLLVLAGVPIVLVMAQPDLGTAIIMVVVLLVMLAVAGLPARILVMLIVGAVLVTIGAVETGLLHHYQIARFTTFLHPNQASNNPFVQSANYNLQASQRTIGSGGFLGTGIGHGTQTNLGYVPEQQTDFIFSAVAEQLGFVGATGLLAMLGIIAWRILRSAGNSRDVFGRLVCAGLFTFVAFSVFQNSGMTMGIMPITGIPLPFVSYGGTAVLCFFMCVGLALSVGARRRMR
jgi:rod shape determining protein RodA